MQSEQSAFHKQAHSEVSEYGKSQAPVKLRFFDVNAADSLLHAAFSPEDNKRIKDKVLANLGITRRDGESYLDAWLRAMAEENGLPVGRPAHRALVDAIMFSSAQKFVWFLA